MCHLVVDLSMDKYISFLSVLCLQDDLNEVEQLLEKHANFEKLVNTQEERFLALERLTTVNKQPAYFLLRILFSDSLGNNDSFQSQFQEGSLL